MNQPQLRGLDALERLRKLREDEERLRFAAASRDMQQASEACEAAEAKLDSLDQLRRNAAGDGVVLNMTRYEFLGVCLQAGEKVQEELRQARDVSDEHYDASSVAVAEAWKSRASVEHKRIRHLGELRRTQETKAMDESTDLWLSRRGCRRS